MRLTRRPKRAYAALRSKVHTSGSVWLQDLKLTQNQEAVCVPSPIPTLSFSLSLNSYLFLLNVLTGIVNDINASCPHRDLHCTTMLPPQFLYLRPCRISTIKSRKLTLQSLAPGHAAAAACASLRSGPEGRSLPTFRESNGGSISG